MYRLGRIRLAGVGPADARFDRPSPDAPPFEVSCLGPSDQPDDTIVWLENGGGKTVFLSLLFHVLRPDRAAQIGNDEQGGRRADIGDFVRAGDVSHVVCEWIASDSDERLLTGLVAERRRGTVNRTWYLVVVRETAITADDLVFDVDGRRVPAARYLESLDQIASTAGRSGRKNRVEVIKTTTQRTWFEVLADHDLDPALFEYQVRMNKAEGGATSLFRFASVERFVEFFLQLTMNPETLQTVSEELVRVAEKVASLPRKELELAHAAGAVERLARLHASWGVFEESEGRTAAARRDAESLHDRLHAALVAAGETLNVAEEQLARAEADRVEADRTRREADTRMKLVAIAVADARIAARTVDADNAATAAADAGLTASAWPRVTTYQRRIALEGRAKELRLALDEADREAAPLRERSDTLLRALRRELDQLARTAAAEMSHTEAEMTAASALEATADGALRAAEARSNEIGGLLTALDAQIARHTDAIETAVAEGLVGRGIAPHEALQRERAAHSRVTESIRATESARGELADELPILRRSARELPAAAVAAGHERDSQRTIVDQARRDRAELSGHPLLAELGAEDVDLELIGADLAHRVAAEADRQRLAAIAAEAGAAEDRRAAEALEHDRLLPARADVDRLCSMLIDGGVASATAGWRYLVETVPSRSHASVIARHPALVDGIVVAAHDIERAKDVLAEAAPAAAIMVAEGAVLTEVGSSAPTGWVVPPSAALHHRGAAEAELERRLEGIAAAADVAARLSTRERSARALADSLEAHLDVWPSGRLPAASALLDELIPRADAAARDAQRAGDAVAAAEELLSDTDIRLEAERKGLARLDSRIVRLEQLATDSIASLGALQDVAALNEERREQGDAAARARTVLGDAKVRLGAARDQRTTAERSLDALRRQLADLPEPADGPAVEESDVVGLRAAYERAAAMVARATTESELAQQLEAIEHDRREAETEWSGLGDELRARTEELAATAAAVDPSARRHAELGASRAAAVANESLASARGALELAKKARNELEDPQPTWPVEPFEIPSALDELTILGQKMDAAFERARERASQIREVLTAATKARDDAQQERERFEVHAEALLNIVGERAAREAEAFEGDPASSVRDAMRRMTDASEAWRLADGEWRHHAHEVGVFARQDRWSSLDGELSRRLRDDAPDDLSRSAGDLLAQTAILESRLREDIDKLDTHRQMLVTSLGDAVAEAARGLRGARNKSELPAGLGDWSHQPFLKIGLDLTGDRIERDGRLRRFANDLLERSATSKAGLPLGADLVCQALLACTERQVTVDVLKPNKAQLLRYVPITETATLSGGMRATAAIAMFCTLAKVRAANRTGRIGVGTLVLDNPLGDANATYLVALQRLVARMNDVQLVYTTGVNDLDALRLFPVVTRLTNEVGKRSHLAYVVADEAFLKRLAPSEGDDAVITGTRLVRRQAPLLTSDIALMPGDDE